MKSQVFIIFMAALARNFGTNGAMQFQVTESRLPGPQFPIGGLPLFDEHTNGLLILRHRFVLKFQLRCILLGAPCDVIGRWLKPRVEKIFLENKCEKCTPTQTKLVYKWVDEFFEKYPDFFRAALAKYAENVGITLDPKEKRFMTEMLGTYP